MEARGGRDDRNHIHTRTHVYAGETKKKKKTLTAIFLVATPNREYRIDLPPFFFSFFFSGEIKINSRYKKNDGVVVGLRIQRRCCYCCLLSAELVPGVWVIAELGFGGEKEGEVREIWI